jgi:glycine hydroxymethyltransferase
VLGLIAGGRFQNPLTEGAHIVFGSSHKTLPGPQGGLIFSNNANWMDMVSDAVYPALVTNHHPFRLPALGMALLEMKKWGSAYAEQIVVNAQQLAAEILSKGVEVVSSRDGRFTESHTILIKAHRFGSAREVAERLERANIIVNSCVLPEQLGLEGIRIGVQEITRLGAKTGDMGPLSSFIVDAIAESRSAADVARDVEAFSEHFQTVHFTWDSDNEESNL